MNGSDQAIVRAFVRGDDGALRTVDGWIRASIGSFRRRLASSWEDVAQDVRLELIERLKSGQFRGEAGLKTYVWRVATHAAITRLRREAVRRIDPVDDVTPAVSTDPSALDHMMKAESDAVVQRVLLEAGAPCRDLWRALIAGRTYAEISRELDVSEGALRVRALRCRQAAIEARFRVQRAPSETNAGLERPS